MTENEFLQEVCERQAEQNIVLVKQLAAANAQIASLTEQVAVLTERVNELLDKKKKNSNNSSAIEMRKTPLTALKNEMVLGLPHSNSPAAIAAYPLLWERKIHDTFCKSGLDMGPIIDTLTGRTDQSGSTPCVAVGVAIIRQKIYTSPTVL